MTVAQPVEASPRRSDASAIGALKFTRRRESWVAQSAGHFYKIVRASDDAMHDFVDPACIASAQREYGDMRFLHGIDAAACCPERIEQACIVYPVLSGPDMHELLTRRPACEQATQCLQAAMLLLARLHCHKADGLPVKNYQLEGFLAPGPRVMARMRDRQRMLVVTGFEARNFRFDKHEAGWFFFDPHHLWCGFPEEDFARFMVSLLMIRGKRGGPRPWTGFDRFALLATYEASTHAKLDRELLDYFVREQLAKRQFYAMRLARHMRSPGNVIGVAYTRLYFQRLHRVLETLRF
ncbi:MAG: hypothetical protein ACREPY_00430 [Rhodanobacteraceae bacterium]